MNRRSMLGSIAAACLGLMAGVKPARLIPRKWDKHPGTPAIARSMTVRPCANGWICTVAYGAATANECPTVIYRVTA